MRNKFCELLFRWTLIGYTKPKPCHLVELGLFKNIYNTLAASRGSQKEEVGGGSTHKLNFILKINCK